MNGFCLARLEYFKGKDILYRCYLISLKPRPQNTELLCTSLSLLAALFQSSMGQSSWCRMFVHFVVIGVVHLYIVKICSLDCYYCFLSNLIFDNMLSPLNCFNELEVIIFTILLNC